MKQTFLLLTAATLTFAACNNAGTSASDKMESATAMNEEESKEQRNMETALAAQAAVNAQDIEAMFKNVAPDGADYGDGTMPPIKGIDSVKAMVKKWFAAFPDQKGENLKATAEGDLVMVWGDWSGTFKNDLMGIKATGKSYKAKDVDIFRFNNEGKIIEHHNILPFSTIMMMTGAKLPRQ